jgi:valyl-tRNA synthetase
MSEPLPPRYEPAEVEARLYAAAKARGDFTADATRSLGLTPDRRFVVMIPPPNVTGALHMGHALNNTLQDVLCRWRRMCGDEVLWLPGTDHAGIATQAVVERKLLEERNLRRVDMGREAFQAEVWRWKEKYGDTILRQLERLGCSCDWTRTKFTMEPALSLAVRKAFVDLWGKGLVYRGPRIVNWDCVLETAVSDDEIEYEDRKGRLWHIRYPLADGSGHLVVATTRPETMLGDTGVAVNPDDDRYRAMVGKKVRLPLVGREIPVVADASVDASFGTGAVKVTPGHDPDDYDRGVRHGLPVVIVLDARGRVNDAGGAYKGLSREQARDRVVKDLEAAGLLEKVEERQHRVAVSDRSKSVIEPLVSEQWFVRMEPLAKPALAALEAIDPATGRPALRFVPERWTKVYRDWLENVRDWCISRQLWWGHRIPVWYDADGVPEALLEDPVPGQAHGKTGKPLVRQDEDVLDTWASSWLWPMSTLGWPDAAAEDFRAFYPTRFLSTAREIIYLWVARMVMAGYEFTDRCPFDTVYIHATVLDARGRRMSKSAGNGIDPVEMIDRYGCDAVRFTLVEMTTEGQDVRLAETRFETGRHFMNKLWNAGRFLEAAGAGVPVPEPDPSALRAEDLWILARLRDEVASSGSLLAEHRFHEFARSLYGFAWNEFCDWYLEIVKPRTEAGDPTARWVLRKVFGTLLHMLHPACPFLTDELAHRLGFLASGEAMARAPWPAPAPPPPGWEAAVLDIVLLQVVVESVRRLRADYRVSEAAKVTVLVRCGEPAAAALRRMEDPLRRLARAEAFETGPATGRPARSAFAGMKHPSYGEIDVYLPLEGQVDLAAESARLAKELEKAEAALAAADRKLAQADFLARAKPEVVEAERARRAELAAQAARLRAARASLS